MGPPSTNHWEKDDTRYNDLLNYIIKRTENVESPMNLYQLVKDFNKKCGDAEAFGGLRYRVFKVRTVIHKIGHIDTNTKVKVLFALSAPVDVDFLKDLQKDALVKVDEKDRITHYKSNDGSLELKGGHSLYEKRSLINKYFKKKKDDDVLPKKKEEKEMRDFIAFITEKCENVNSPLSIRQLTKDFNNHFGLSRSINCINKRVIGYRREIQETEFLDISSKVKQLFGVSARLDSNFLKELRKDAVVEVDDLNRITKYTANNGSLTLHGDHRSSTKQRTALLASKRSHQSLINNHFKYENDADAVPDTEEEKEMGKLIEFISEKCDNVNAPLNITQLIEDFIQHFGIARTFDCIKKRLKTYRREIQKTEFLDTFSKVKQLFGLSVTLDLDYLEKLRKDAVVEVDELNRITKYTDNYDRLTLHGKHSPSAKRKLNRIERRKNKNAVKKQCISGDNTDEKSEKEDEYSEDDSDEYSSEEFGSEFDSDDENDDLDETEDFVEPSNEAYDSDNETSNRSIEHSEISIDDNFDFEPPTERSHVSEGIEMREDDEKEDPEINRNAAVETKRSETLPTSKTSFSTSHTPKPPKRKVDASGGSITLKRTKPLTEESKNPRNSNDNISHDDPPRVELDPFHEPHGLPRDIQRDPDIQQIQKPHSQVMEVIKKEYEEEAQTSLKTVLKAFKSLILSLDTSGLSQLQMELDTKIMETGRGIEVSNKEVVLAMDFFIIKLSKHGALKSSEEAISLRDVLLMLRTIILNSSFNDLEVILEMLKENINRLSVLDKKVAVSKVECVLRATLDSIST